MEGDPLLPGGGYREGPRTRLARDPQDEVLVDWGMQPDGAYLMPSFQSSQDVPENRCFGIQRDEPCGCRKMSVRMRHIGSINTETKVTCWDHTWSVHALHVCEDHK